MELPKSVVTSQNQVYVIEDAYVKLRDVEPVEFRTETIVVQGIPKGTQVIIDPVDQPIQGIKATSL